MCGRFSLAVSKERINKQFNLSIEKDLEKSYNIAPTQEAYVISNKEPKLLQKMTGGLVPYWSKDSHIKSNLINARSEGIASRPSFRIPVRKRRCLVLADGFYEWRKEGRNRVPYRVVHNNNKIMAMAGIWDVWRTPEGSDLITFAILTTKPNAEMKTVHDRMPVILPTEEAQKNWLKDLTLEQTLDMLQTLGEGQLDVFPVSQKVGSPDYNESELYQPIQLPPTLF
jgi:putative SOS response-associated peptidase YedK